MYPLQVHMLDKNCEQFVCFISVLKHDSSYCVSNHIFREKKNSVATDLRLLSEQQCSKHKM